MLPSALINNLINLKNYEHYLEIGCNNNITFDKVVCLYKEGVDPIKGGTVRCTSDQFFILNKKKFDIIYIDGLHLKDQVLRDINNSLDALNEDGIILMHDCIPASEIMQITPLSAIYHHPQYKPATGWTGDVWRAALQVRNRPDVDFACLKTGTGIGCIIKRSNSSVLTYDHTITWSEFDANKQSLLRIKGYNELLTWIG